MARFNGFLDNLVQGTLNPKGSVGDFKHASRLYVDDVFKYAPKTKFLFFVNFELSKEASDRFPILRQNFIPELNMLCKTVDLPQFSASIDVKNQYNRKKVVQTAIDYTPVNIVMHDDNFGVTTLLLEAYYKYYYGDSLVKDPSDAYNARNTYSASRVARYGLDNGTSTPFFRSIKLYQLSRQQYTEFTLVNPLIERWGHDSMDQADGSGLSENTMVINYETVLYARGSVGEDNPATFASSHYDTTPSPLKVEGGGVENLFNNGGVLDGAGGILGDFASGEVGLSTLLTGANTLKNAKGLSRESIFQEGISIFNTAVTNTGKQEAGGLAGTTIAKDSGQGSSSQNTQAASTPGGPALPNKTAKTTFAQQQAGLPTSSPPPLPATNLWVTERVPKNRGLFGQPPGGNT